MVFSFEPAKNPMCRPSGDQNGYIASSVPGSGRAARLSSDRTHRRAFPEESLAVNAICWPSGERAGGPAPSLMR